MSPTLPTISHDPCGVFDLLALIDSVSREAEFWPRLNRRSYSDDARNELWLIFHTHPEKLGPSPAYASQSIRNALRDLLKKEFQRGLRDVPPEVYQSPRGLEKDTRRFLLAFADDDPNAHNDEMYGVSKEPHSILYAQSMELVTVEVERKATLNWWCL